MRNFPDIQRELKLMKFLDSPLGDLYCVPAAPGAPRIMVRRFNRDLPATLVPAYAGLLRDAQAWIERDPGLAELVRVEQPQELGGDFIARPYHLGTSLAAFSDDEDPSDPPDELAQMQGRFRELAAAPSGLRDALLVQLLARSILAPTAKTIYSFREERFIITDLKFTRDELERWSALQG